MKVRFLTPAEIEMLEASIYYENQTVYLGDNFLDIVEAAIAEIAKSPEIWPEIDPGIRRRVLRRFPYSILYQIIQDEVIVVAVMHHKQKPRYWINRL